MKTSKTIAILLVFFLSINSCGQKDQQSQDSISEMRIVKDDSEIEAEYSIAESSNGEVADMKSSVSFTPPTISSSNSQVDFTTSKAASAENDGDKKFIRAAQLNIKAKDIVLTAHRIEDIIIAKKGFIINSYLNSSDQYSTEKRVSKDSILVSNHVNLAGTLVLRVHYSLLDQALREIALLAEQVKFRNITAQDVTFDMIANRLEQKREKEKSARMRNITGAGRGHRLDDLIDAEEAINRARAAADNAVVEEMKRDDLILYSTITIQIEQEPLIVHTMKAREADVKEYSPPFFESLADGIVDGWKGLLMVIAGLFTIWPLLLLGGAILYVTIYFRRKKRGKRMGE